MPLKTRLLGLTTIEQMMLQSVVQSGGNGIWSRDLRRKCGLQQAQFAKFLKNLEARKLIKSFKPVTAKNRKHYLAYNTEPSSELTGGPWYNDSGAFDEQYVTTMRDTLLQFLRYSKEPQTVGQLMKLVDKSEVSSVRIDASQILLLCHRLVAEGNALEEPARGSSVCLFLFAPALFSSIVVDAQKACVDNSARGTPIDTNERRFRAVATVSPDRLFENNSYLFAAVLIGTESRGHKHGTVVTEIV